MRLLMVDHSSEPGGGQLGLQRYAASSSELERSYLFLEGGEVARRVASFANDVVVSNIPGTGLTDLVRYRKNLADEIARFGPDIIVANSLRSAVAVSLARIDTPALYYVRQDMSVDSMGRAQRAAAVRAVFPKFSGFIANSKWTATTIPQSLKQNRYMGIAPPISGVSGISPRTVPPLVNPRPKLLWIGRLARWKGLHIVLQALKLLEMRGVDVDLVVAGAAIHEGAEYQAEIAKHVAQLRTPPKFLGHVPDVEPLLHDADVLIHSSTIPEPFGQVIVQGMAAATPVVATAIGGPSEILDDGSTGLLVPPSDPLALTEALLTLIAAPGKAAEMGLRARTVVDEQYTDEVLAATFDKVVRVGFQAVRGSP